LSEQLDGRLVANHEEITNKQIFMAAMVNDGILDAAEETFKLEL